MAKGSRLFLLNLHLPTATSEFEKPAVLHKGAEVELSWQLLGWL
jgi:hypothetical protein